MRIKNIVLVEPEAPGDHVYKTVKMPRLGLPLLGTILKEKGYAVRVLLGGRDSIFPRDIDVADLVGVSTTTSTSAEAYRIARYARSRKIPAIIGGIHATFLPEEALAHADYVVRGEAETSFPALIRSIEEKRLPTDIRGVSYWDGAEMVHNPDRDTWEDVNAHPIPDLSMIGKLSTYPVMTSRGCPFDCSFCSVTPMFGRKFRYRNTELVLQELERYRKEKVFFVDDNFTAKRSRAKELLRSMIDMNILPRYWGAQVRVDVAHDPELLDLMRRTNGRMAYIGLESISPETLASYNKQQDIGDIKEAIRALHEYRIGVHGMFMLGGEGDTVESIRETVDFALDMHIDTVQFLVLTPLPGTPLFDQLEAEGRLLTRNWHLYDGQHVVYRPARVEPEVLQQEMVTAYKKFYSFRNMFKNVFVTGLNSTLFRGVGWWLSRHFEKQSRPYYGELGRFLDPVPLKQPLFKRKLMAFNRSGTASSLKSSQLQIYLSMRKDVLYMRIKGLANRATLQALKQEFKQVIPAEISGVVVNLEGLKFVSGNVAKQFTHFLGNAGNRVRKLEVFCRVGDGLRHIIEKYTKSMPSFVVIEY